MKWFKKKQVEEQPVKKVKMDMSKYKMDLSIKSICMFEKLSGKSFYNFTDDDIPQLLYSSFYCSNDMEIKYETFIGLLNNPQFAKWVAEQYTDILAVMRQFAKIAEVQEEKKEEKASGATYTMSDIANTLIIDYGVDAHYVMYEMDIWEIEKMYEVVQTKIQNHYEEERLWTYMNIMPHIDTKKIKGPEKLLPFPWEKDVKKKNVEEGLKNNLYAVQHTIGMNIDDILNGKK